MKVGQFEITTARNAWRRLKATPTRPSLDGDGFERGFLCHVDTSTVGLYGEPARPSTEPPVRLPGRRGALDGLDQFIASTRRHKKLEKKET